MARLEAAQSILELVALELRGIVGGDRVELPSSLDKVRRLEEWARNPALTSRSHTAAKASLQRSSVTLTSYSPCAVEMYQMPRPLSHTPDAIIRSTSLR